MGKRQGRSHFAIHNPALHSSGSERLHSIISMELFGRCRFVDFNGIKIFRRKQNVLVKKTSSLTSKHRKERP